MQRNIRPTEKYAYAIFILAVVGGFALLYLISLQLLPWVTVFPPADTDRLSFKFFQSTLEGVAGIAGAVVAIILASIAIKVSRLAAISQSPEYQAAYVVIQSVWEVDALLTMIEASHPIESEDLSERLRDAAFRPEMMMLRSSILKVKGVDKSEKMRQLSQQSLGEISSRTSSVIAMLSGAAFLVDEVGQDLRALQRERHSEEISRNPFLYYLGKISSEIGLPERKLEPRSIPLVARRHFVSLRFSNIPSFESLLMNCLTGVWKTWFGTSILPEHMALPEHVCFKLSAKQVVSRATIESLIPKFSLQTGNRLDVRYITDALDEHTLAKEMALTFLPGSHTLVIVADSGKTTLDALNEATRQDRCEGYLKELAQFLVDTFAKSQAAYEKGDGQLMRDHRVPLMALMDRRLTRSISDQIMGQLYATGPSPKEKIETVGKTLCEAVAAGRADRSFHTVFCAINRDYEVVPKNSLFADVAVRSKISADFDIDEWLSTEYQNRLVDELDDFDWRQYVRDAGKPPVIGDWLKS